MEYDNYTFGQLSGLTKEEDDVAETMAINLNLPYNEIVKNISYIKFQGAIKKLSGQGVVNESM